MSRNTAMMEAAALAEQDMGVFRRALRQKAAKRQAAEKKSKEEGQSPSHEQTIAQSQK